MIKPMKNKRLAGMVLFCLLSAICILSQWTGTVYGEDGVQQLNDSGSPNRELAVDPIQKKEGFSAVLYNNRNGLPTSEANAIVHTREGFIWIGSYAGLIRYDGNTFERIDSSEGIANVRCLYVDSKDRLWIGTNDAGLFLMKNGEIRKWNKADGLKANSIRSIEESDEGLIYAGSASGGIALIDTEFNLTVLEDERIEGQTVPELRRGNDGLIYGVTSGGDLFTLKGDKLVSFAGHDEYGIEGITCILPDPGNPGHAYIGSSGSKLFYASFDGSFEILKTRGIYPLSAMKRMEAIGSDIWICAGNGIGKLDDKGFHLLKNVPMYNSVEHVLTDYEGNLWFTSSRQGVMKIVPDQFSDLFERYNLEETVVNSTCMLGHQLFIGTDTGLIVMRDGIKVGRIPLSQAVTASGEELKTTDLLSYLDGVRIRSIIRDSRDRLWISTWRSLGLLRYDHGKLMAFTNEDGLLSDMDRVVSECEDGSILAASTGGVSIIRDDYVEESYDEEDGIDNGEILTVEEGFRHEHILGSDGGGMYVFSPDGARHIGTEDGLSSEIILRVKRSRYRDIYWILTSNSLAWMTPDYQVTTIRHFPSSNNFDLFENSKGDVWVLSGGGIYIASAEDLLADSPNEPVFYGMQSGLPYTSTANSYSELTAGGDLYFSGTAGVVKVNIEAPFEDIGELKAALPFIDADGERFFPDDSGKYALPGNVRKLTLYPYVFTYSLIDPQVSWHLEGFETSGGTVSRGKLAPVDYTNLPLGTYQFIMTVKDPVGHTEQTVSFEIIKGKELTVGTIGTIVMGAASLVLMAGILIFTSLYRKRGQTEDKLFFGLIISNIAMTVGELLSYVLEYSTVPFAREMMILGNTTYYILYVFFPYLFLMYLAYSTGQDKIRLRIRKILYGIPCLLFFIIMMINLKTGWIFWISGDNVFHSGDYDELLILPVVSIWFYLLISLVKVYRINVRLVTLGIMLIGARLLWDISFRSISSTPFIYTLIILCIHVYAMNQPLYKEAS